MKCELQIKQIDDFTMIDPEFVNGIQAGMNPFQSR